MADFAIEYNSREGCLNMKRIVRMISLGLAVCLLALCFCGCDEKSSNDGRTDEQKIRDRVDAFVTAINSRDTDAAASCLDSSSRSLYNAATVGQSLLGAFTDVDLDLGNVFAKAIGLSDDGEVSAEIQKLDITTDTAAAVTLAASVQMNRETKNQTIQLEMVKEKNDWYISVQVDWSALLSSVK